MFSKNVVISIFLFSNLCLSAMITYSSGVNYISGDEGYTNITVINNAVLYINGGNYDYINIYDNSHVFFSDVYYAGRVGLTNNGTATIYGNNFFIASQNVEPQTITRNPSDYPYTMVPITAVNNEHTFTGTFYLLEDSKVVLVPEPSTLLLISAGSLLAVRNKAKIKANSFTKEK